MRVYIKKGFVYFLIICFLTLGIVGLILPFVPQFIFFAVALILISLEVPWAQTKIESLLEKYPEWLKKYREYRNILEKYLK